MPYYGEYYTLLRRVICPTTESNMPYYGEYYYGALLRRVLLRSPTMESITVREDVKLQILYLEIKTMRSLKKKNLRLKTRDAVIIIDNFFQPYFLCFCLSLFDVMFILNK